MLYFLSFFHISKILSKLHKRIKRNYNYLPTKTKEYQSPKPSWYKYASTTLSFLKYKRISQVSLSVQYFKKSTLSFLNESFDTPSLLIICSIDCPIRAFSFISVFTILNGLYSDCVHFVLSNA